MASDIYESAAEAIRLMIDVFQASVEHNVSRHAWLPPDAIKEHYYPHPNNVRGEHDYRLLQQENRNLPAMRV